MKTAIFLIRHGEVDANNQKLVCGHLDQSLNAVGREQVKSLSVDPRFLKDASVEVISSHLKRAHETAQSLFPGVAIKVDQRFSELNAGDFNLLPVAELHKNHPQFIAHSKTPELQYPNGESLNGFWDRVSKGMDEVMSSSKSSIALVSHGGVINVILHSLLRVPLSLYPTFEIPNASITKLSYDKSLGFYRLNYLGKTPCTIS